MRKVLFMMALFCVAALAADVTGTWKAEVQTPNGTFTSTYNFKADGDKLTGTVSGRAGEVPIENGKINGDTITFTVTRKFQDREMKSEYTGKVNGNEMELTTHFGDREVKMTAKKQ